MTSQYGSVSGLDNNKTGFKPQLNDAQHKVTPDWSKVEPAQWIQTMEQLATSVVSPDQRLYWMLAFRGWVKATFDNEPSQSLQIGNKQYDETILRHCLTLMSQVSYNLCDWPMMIELYGLGQQLFQPLDKSSVEQNDIIEYLQLAVAYWQMGQLQQADQFLDDKGELFGADNPLIDFHQQIKRDIERIPFVRSECEQGELLLMPLEEQHLSGFSWVYHDPNIAQLCNLPEFTDDEQWYNWLGTDQLNDNKEVFAVIHSQWGFIGSVSIEVHDGVGFFYYWLGQDFQGGGLGPKAVTLLLELAEQYMDMTCCYAKVFSDNMASQKALDKLDFKPVPFKIAAPNDNQMYYYRGPDKALEHWGKELVKLAAITDIENTILL